MTKLREPRWVTYWRHRRERFRAEVLRGGGEILAEGTLLQANLIAVTSRSIVWEEGRYSVSLPFDAIQSADQTLYETHRYALTLNHHPIGRPRDKALPWDLPRHWRRFRARHRWNRESVLKFSRRDTAAARAIRAELARRSIPLGPVVDRPHRREDGMLYRLGPLRSWWIRRRFGL